MWCRAVLSVCLLAEMEALAAGEAVSGRIVFSGAVVVPTCVQAGRGMARGPATAWRTCRAGERSRTGARHAAATAYRISVRTLDKTQAASHPVVTWRSRRRGHVPPSRLRIETRTYR